MFQLAERVSETTDGVATDWSGSFSPLFKRFLRPTDRRLVILVRGGADARELCSVDGRDLVDLRVSLAAGPLTGEDARIFLAQSEFLEDRLHRYFRFRQYCRIKPIASSTTSAVMSSAGRKRIDRSPERNVNTPRSNRPFQNLSRVSASGRSNASNNPRPRTAEIVGS